MRYLFFACISLFLLTASSEDGSTPFEGTIAYAINYIEIPEEVKGMESMLPQEMKMTLKGSKTRIEQSVMGGSQIVIADTDANTSYILMDMMGQKIAITITPEELEEAKGTSGTKPLTYHDEVKKILGYKCYKATYTEGGMEQELYYCPKITLPNGAYKEFEGIKGCPLFYSTTKDNMKLEMTATDVSEHSVSDDLFTVPSGYTMMTQEELQQMFGG